MNRHHYLEAIETVLAWDLPEEAIADAITLNTAFEEDAWVSYSTQSDSFH